MLIVFLVVLFQIFSGSQSLTCNKCKYPCWSDENESVECDTACYTWAQNLSPFGRYGGQSKGCIPVSSQNLKESKSKCSDLKQATNGTDSCLWCDDYDFCNGDIAYELCTDCALEFSPRFLGMERSFRRDQIVGLLLMYITSQIHVDTPDSFDIQTIISDENDEQCFCDDLHVEDIGFPNFMKLTLLFSQQLTEIEGVPPLAGFIKGYIDSCKCNVDIKNWTVFNYIEFLKFWSDMKQIEMPNDEVEVLSNIFLNFPPCEFTEFLHVWQIQPAKLVKLLLVAAQAKDKIPGVPEVDDYCLVNLLV